MTARPFIGWTATLLLTAVASATLAAQPPSASPAAQLPAKKASYSDRYGVIEQHNVFLRDRSRHYSSSSSGPGGSSGTTQPTHRSPEETLILTGIVLEDEGYRAYIEDPNRPDVLKLSPGDAVARGKVASIQMDAIAYEQNGQRTWVEVGSDLTGHPSELLAPSSAGFATTTGPVVASDIAGLNPNDPNLTLEQKMKLRRAMQLNVQLTPLAPGVQPPRPPQVGPNGQPVPNGQPSPNGQPGQSPYPQQPPAQFQPGQSQPGQSQPGQFQPAQPGPPYPQPGTVQVQPNTQQPYPQPQFDPQQQQQQQPVIITVPDRNPEQPSPQQ